VLFLAAPPTTSAPVCRPSSQGEGFAPSHAAQSASTPAPMLSALTETPVPSYLNTKVKTCITHVY